MSRPIAIAAFGCASRDVLGSSCPRMGGGAQYFGTALAQLGAPGVVIVKAGSSDCSAVRAATPTGRSLRLHCVEGRETTAFALAYAGEQCIVRVDALGDPWTEAEVKAALSNWAPDSIAIHVAPNFREDFSIAALRLLACGRCLSLDGQALVRRRELGSHGFDVAFDPAMLADVSILKCNEEEADAVLSGLGLKSPEDLRVPEVVITRGARGATVFAAGTRIDIPGDFVPVDDPTGAGDFFAAAYLVARTRDRGPAQAAAFANDLSASMLRRRVTVAER